MSRRRAAVKREVLPDAKFGDTVLTKFMNCLMYEGKKSVAERIVYGALDRVAKRSGQDALRVAREHKGSPIRLVITDVIMPVMGGKVMAEWLRTTYPDLKILFTSGYTDDTISHHGVLEAGIAFLSKPYTPATLARKVREILDDGSVHQPPAARKVAPGADTSFDP